MAYVRNLYQNTRDSHQTSPAYVLTIVRWNNRDTVNYKEPNELTRKNFVVINDAIDIQIGESKSNITGSLNVTLMAGDINYATAFHPGDYIIVNLLNDEKKAMEVYNRASDGLPINRYEDGFKGLYKIQKIRRQIVTDPSSGKKTYQFMLHAFSFTELNSVIYFNPTAAAALGGNEKLFLTRFSDFWSGIVTSDSNVQSLHMKLTKALLGSGLNKSDFTISESQNAEFIVPPSVSALMNRGNGKKTITDIYNFIYGVWKANGASTETNPNSDNIKPGVGFNPNIKAFKSDKNFFVVSGGNAAQLKGYNTVQVEDFNQKKIWSIMQTYSNSAINESYTANRVGIDGNVYPSIIVRQKPFNSVHFGSSDRKVNGKKNAPIDYSHTKFLEIPRWKISPSLIYGIDLGKDDIGRINFVQLYGRSLSVVADVNQAYQAFNIFFDQEDIKRHGMRPAVITSNFDYPQSTSLSDLQAKSWSWLLFDMLNGMHLRESGTISCYGIEEPIAVGDNIEFDNAVYHIEGISHKMSMDVASGIKSFRTQLTVSFGTGLDSNRNIPAYPQMEKTDSLTERLRDKEGIYPGFSDTQHLPRAEGNSRILGEEVKKTEEASFTLDPSDKKGKSRASTVHYRESHKPDRNGPPKKDK